MQQLIKVRLLKFEETKKNLTIFQKAICRLFDIKLDRFQYLVLHFTTNKSVSFQIGDIIQDNHFVKYVIEDVIDLKSNVGITAKVIDLQDTYKIPIKVRLLKPYL